MGKHYVTRGSMSIFTESAFIACLTLGVLRNGLTMLAVPTYYQNLFTGVIILVAIVISELRSREE